MKRSLIATIAAAALLFSAMACGGTPTEFSPLVRATGEVRGVLLRVTGLVPLTVNEGTYHAWAVFERNRTEPLGPFNVDAAGQIVDLDGQPFQQFEATTFNAGDALGVLVTFEPIGRQVEGPSSFQILSGAFVNNVAPLSVPFPGEIASGNGSVRIFTPTNGPDSNESSGFWFVDSAGDPSLSLPAPTQQLTYELFIDTAGETLTLGRFEDPEMPDTTNSFSGVDPAPQAPGEDFLINPPEGSSLIFPLDLSGTRITVSLEGRFEDVTTRSQLIVLEGFLPAGLRGGEIITLINRTADFPTGSAVLF